MDDRDWFLRSSTSLPNVGYAAPRPVFRDPFTEQTLLISKKRVSYVQKKVVDLAYTNQELSKTKDVLSRAAKELTSDNVNLARTNGQLQRVIKDHFESTEQLREANLVLEDELERVRAEMSAAALAHTEETGRLAYQMDLLHSDLQHLEELNQSYIDSNASLRTKIDNLDSQLAAARSVQEDKVKASQALAQSLQDRSDETGDLVEKLSQRDAFIWRLVDLRLHDPVLSKAYQAHKNGEDVDAALVNAILEAASKEHSAWSRIIPAVAGPRSPELYLSAMHAIVQVKKELHVWKKTAVFWRDVAKRSAADTSIITPSPSTLSDLSQDLFKDIEGGSMIFDDLLATVREGHPVRKKDRLGLPTLEELRNHASLEELISQSTVSLLSSFPSPSSDAFSYIPNIPHAIQSPNTSSESDRSLTPLWKHSNNVVRDHEATLAKEAEESDPATPADSSSRQEPITTACMDSTNVAPNQSVQDHSEADCTPSPVVGKTPIASKIPATPPRPKQPGSPHIGSNVRVTPPKAASTPPYTRGNRVAKAPSTSPKSINKAFQPPTTPIRSRLSTPRRPGVRSPLSPTSNRPANGSAESMRRSPPKYRHSEVMKTGGTKDLTKRRGVIMREMPRVTQGDENQPLLARQKASSRSSLSSTRGSPVTRTTSNGENQSRPRAHLERRTACVFRPLRNSETSDVIPQPSNATSSDAPGPSAYPAIRAASEEDALQMAESLERICAAFSGSSLGSLEMSDEEPYDSDSDLRALVDDEDDWLAGQRPLEQLRHALDPAIESRYSLPDLCEDAGKPSNRTEGSSASAPVMKTVTWATSVQWKQATSDSGSMSSSGSLSSIDSPLRRRKETGSGPTPRLQEKQSPFRPPRAFRVPRSATMERAGSPGVDVAILSPSLTPYVRDGLPTLARNPAIKIRRPSADLQEQTISRKASPTRATRREAPAHVPQLVVPDLQYPAPSFAEISPTWPLTNANAIATTTGKPRSNTINILSPIPTSPPGLHTESLAFCSTPITKPRSYTFNTFSPTTRSPLSQHVMTSSLDSLGPTDVGKPASVSPLPTRKARLQSDSMEGCRTADSYFSPMSTLHKGHLLLLGGKEGLALTPGEREGLTLTMGATPTPGSPPTAAFMRPLLSRVPSRKNTSSIVGPLIPEVPSDPDGNATLSALQYRNLIKRGLNMVVR